MINEHGVADTRTEVAPGIFRLGIVSPNIAAAIQSGQFINIKIGDTYQPLLRRPFSVQRVEGDRLLVLFNIVGEGTRFLATVPPGTTLDILGPLGHPFVLDDDFETALLVAGGLGVAPFPLFAQRYGGLKRIITFVGARTSSHIAAADLVEPRVATDDGSAGFHGTVVELVRSAILTEKFPKPRLFGCGPNPMLRALSALAKELNIPCEVSLESPMACGIGICQGCPVELIDGERKYALICKDGTVFDSARVKI